MLRKEVQAVIFSAEEIGLAIVNDSDKTQRQVLIAMANAVDEMGRTGGSWPMQCRAIVDGFGEGLSTHDRSRISSMLSCLIDHLNE